ncbi:MAG: hypothetical protein ACLPIC_18420 [Rhodoblastus sp.]|uniref:hypothetical protein n=1 Tax=Rhodoblastus sp. TaxID=1962975 RepID=UPI003F97BFF5
MMDFNLLTEPLIRTSPNGALSLPGVLAAFARDEVDSFPGLRPHQEPAWHMFLVQLAALALHRAGLTDAPTEEEHWRELLRALTLEFSDDAPWRLVVEDRSKPAFLQPPVPASVRLDNPLSSPDALDLLITSKNHDLKQAVARHAGPDDWIFALVSLQTGEGYGGAGNQGVARMNGGSSSRPMMSLAPLFAQGAKVMAPRAGAWFCRDLRALLETRDRELEDNDYLQFLARNGLGLIWLADWPEGEQLQLQQLDIWFIEICRRIRLAESNGVLTAFKGTSKTTRIDAKALKGALADPFAPVHKNESKSLTLGEGDFDYRRLTALLLSGDWSLPVLAHPASFEREGETLALVFAALSRGNSKTEGFKSRILPVGGKIVCSLGARREALHQVAQAQMGNIAIFDKALAFALALAAAGGDRDKIKKEHYRHAHDARSQLDRAADAIFFDHLWSRFAAQETGTEAVEVERLAFARALFAATKSAFDAALPALPCAGIFRPRAEARAARAFAGRLRKTFPDLFEEPLAEDDQNAA